MRTSVIGMCLLCVSLVGCRAQPEDPPQSGRISIVGRLACGMVAIGGDTTGYAITIISGQKSAGRTLELDFQRNEYLLVEAMKLDGRIVRVRGTLEIYHYHERGAVPTIRVDALSELPNDHPLPPEKKS